MSLEDIGKSMRLEVGRSALVQMPWPIVRISVADPLIAEYQLMDDMLLEEKARPEEVLLLGISYGTTDLIIWGESGEIFTTRISVEIDLDQLNADLGIFFPHSSVKVSKSLGMYVASGLLERAEQVSQLRQYLDTMTINYVDMTRLAGLQQVQIKVRVAEVNRSAIRNMGVSAFQVDDEFFGVSNVGPNTTTIGVPGGTPAASDVPFFFGEASISPLVTVLAGFPNSDLELFIQALETNQYLRVLAEPTLVAMSGHEATFLAGGEFPIPVPQASGGGGGSTTITIEFKEFGIRLRFLPTVLGGGAIRLHVAPEVSELSDAGGIAIAGGITIPALLTRKADTTVELNSGQTFALAGLLSQSISAQNSRLPLLGNLPVLGPLFRSVQYQSGESELVVLATATLVEPLDHNPNRLVPGDLYEVPNDWELYLQGRIEGMIWESSSSPDGARINQSVLKKLKGPGAWATYHQGASAKRSPVNPTSSATPGGAAATRN
jgi:pilus assembly protein CpaC